MAYTVKDLSKISGVTVRTLHFYEEEGILHPAYYGSNGYRYYEEKQLIDLQQILFFKELGFTIKQIKKIIGKTDFDQLSALFSHKKTVVQERERLGKLLKTIDNTISHLQGKKKMKHLEMFEGFNVSIIQKSEEDIPYFQEEETVLKSVRNQDGEKTREFYQNMISIADDIFKKIVICMESGQKPDSSEVQNLIAKHHAYIDQFHDATLKVYAAMAKLYVEHPGFKRQLDPFHEKLAEFMSEAMLVFVKDQA